MKQKITNIIFGFLLLSIFSTSCIREDLSICESLNKLLLSYKGDGTTEIFNEKICRVEMFVFDADNQCVNSSVLTDEQLSSRTVILPHLDAGTYRIICVGNTHDTKIEGTETGDYSRMLFGAEDYFAGRQVSTNDSLYYASTLYDILSYEDLAGEEKTQTIEFASSHYDFSVEVVGIPEAGFTKAADTPFELRLSALSPYTDFENVAGGPATDYILETTYDASDNILRAFANIMRHRDHSDVLLTFSYDGNVLADVNLADFLAEHPSIDCSKHEVLIPIRIEFKSGEVEITVPDWDIEDIRPN